MSKKKRALSDTMKIGKIFVEFYAWIGVPPPAYPGSGHLLQEIHAAFVKLPAFH